MGILQKSWDDHMWRQNKLFFFEVLLLSKLFHLHFTSRIYFKLVEAIDQIPLNKIKVFRFFANFTLFILKSPLYKLFHISWIFFLSFHHFFEINHQNNELFYSLVVISFLSVFLVLILGSLAKYWGFEKRTKGKPTIIQE